MPLSGDDIKKMAMLGLRPEGFSSRRAGVTYLRNVKHRCVFLSEDSRCRVYSSRPLGCRLYPIIYDELRGVMLDKACTAWRTVTERDVQVAKPILLKLIREIYESKA